MRNINLRREGSKLVVTIDLSAEGTPSASGKTVVIASTHGNIDVPDTKGLKLGINVYAYPGYEIDGP
jgi:hypothetical protein